MAGKKVPSPDLDSSCLLAMFWFLMSQNALPPGSLTFKVVAPADASPRPAWVSLPLTPHHSTWDLPSAALSPLTISVVLSLLLPSCLFSTLRLLRLEGHICLVYPWVLQGLAYEKWNLHISEDRHSLTVSPGKGVYSSSCLGPFAAICSLSVITVSRPLKIHFMLTADTETNELPFSVSVSKLKRCGFLYIIFSRKPGLFYLCWTFHGLSSFIIHTTLLLAVLTFHTLSLQMCQNIILFSFPLLTTANEKASLCHSFPHTLGYMGRFPFFVVVLECGCKLFFFF